MVAVIVLVGFDYQWELLTKDYVNTGPDYNAHCYTASNYIHTLYLDLYIYILLSVLSVFLHLIKDVSIYINFKIIML